jgi:hypothetical protein
MLVSCLQLLEHFHLLSRKMFIKCCSLLLVGAVAAVAAIAPELMLRVALEEVPEDGHKEYLTLFPVKQLLERLGLAVLVVVLPLEMLAELHQLELQFLVLVDQVALEVLVLELPLRVVRVDLQLFL